MKKSTKLAKEVFLREYLKTKMIKKVRGKR